MIRKLLSCKLLLILAVNVLADFSRSIHPSYQHQANIDYDGILNIKLEHDLSDDGSLRFTERANISIPSLRLGQSTVTNVPLLINDQNKIRVSQSDDFFY